MYHAIVFLPLVGFLIAGLLGRVIGPRPSEIVTTALLFVSAVLSWIAFIQVGYGEAATRVQVAQWFASGDLMVDWAFRIDTLTVVMLVVVNTVSALVHLYSIGYMHEDPHRQRFFAYLSLFTFAMLMLVTADNLVQMFFGWEGVGLASYLLIGFWYEKDSANAAAIKAFVVNRVGDFGFLLGIFLIFVLFGSVSFDQIFPRAAELADARFHFIGFDWNALTLACLLLFMGAMGKSAQFLLHTWLPDAMEGPTPVSALIHAATMVTAGVYLIARSAPIFDASQAARTVVTIIGAITLLYGCINGCAQDDLKRVLANSTVSQIGYMFLAVGLGPGVYAIGIIHLLGHGFFKAALFLSAGSVMHAMNDRIDMRRFGGLWRVMPITFGVFACGYLAIIGFPGATGFWTKDKIIEAAFDKGGTSGYVLGICALVGAGITAFYMTRALVMTFLGKKRWEDDVHPHEAPSIMTWPMMALGALSLVGGYLLIFGGGVQHWLEPSVGPSIEEGAHTVSPTVLTLITLLVVALGVLGGWVAFGTKPVPVTPPVGVSPVTTAARRNLYADAFNETVLMRPGQWLTRALVFFDNRGVDGAVNGAAAGFGGGSARLRRLQTGFVRSYALSMLGGTIAVVAVLLAVRFQ
jgi:NADH-quinone oxidoreductase subunit L